MTCDKVRNEGFHDPKMLDGLMVSGTDDAANWPRSSNLLAPRWQCFQRCPDETSSQLNVRS